MKKYEFNNFKVFNWIINKMLLRSSFTINGKQYQTLITFKRFLKKKSENTLNLYINVKIYL